MVENKWQPTLLVSEPDALSGVLILDSPVIALLN